MTYKNLMYKSFLNIRLMEKNYKYIFNTINQPLIKDFYIVLKPNMKHTNIYKFIGLLVILEKNMNNKFIFILNKKILSKKKILKVASIVKLNKKSINNFFLMNIQYTYSKLIENQRSLKFIPNIKTLNKNQILNDNLKKILFQHFYHYDKDSYNYYDFISETFYNIDFCFQLNIKSNYIAHTILSSYNFNSLVFNTLQEQNFILFFSDEDLSDSDLDSSYELDRSYKLDILENQILNKSILSILND